MKKLFSKLNSKKGASLIIALVFMLFACFVGGSVLAAATVNGGRIRSQTVEKQDYLDQRSIAQLLVNELAAPSSDKTRLTVQLTEATWTPMVMGDGGVMYEDTSGSRTQFTERTLAFRPYSRQDDKFLREALYESAAMRYLALTYPGKSYQEIVNPANPADKLTILFENFTLSYDDFWVKLASSEPDPVSLTIQDPVREDKTVTAELVCLGSEDDRYSAAVTFGDSSQLNLHMYAKVSDAQEVNVPAYPDTRSGSTDYWRVEKKITSTVIEWENPTVVKGGAEK